MKSELDVFKNIRKIKILKNLINLSLSLIISNLSSKVLDIIIKIEQKQLIELIIFLVSILTINTIIEHYFSYVLFKKELKANNKLKIFMYSKLYNLTVNEVENLGDGEVKELLNVDLNVIEAYFKTHIPNIINGIISTLAIGIYIVLYNSTGLHILCIISLLQLIPIIIIKKYLIINYNEIRSIEAEISESYMDLYKGLDVIKNHGLYNWFNKFILDKHNKSIRIGIKSEAIGKIEESLNQLANILVQILTYVVVGIYIYIGKIDFEIGIQVIMLSTHFYTSVNSIFNGVRSRILFINSYNRVKEKIYIFKEFESEKENIDSTLTQCIQLENVSFGYDNLILEDISLEIADKEKIIILGKNGQGKTTLFKLMLRLYVPCEGSVRHKYGNSKIGWLPQIDYNFTICGKKLLEKMNTEGLLDINKTLDMLNKFKVKKESLENIPISSLSGGEKKKIFLAITLNSFSNIIFLDEPTNQLDVFSKELLKEIIAESTKTIIMITHDQELLDLSDKIFNIHDKKIQLIEGVSLL